MYGNGLGYHWKGLYNESLADALGKSLVSQGSDLPHQAKFVALVGDYLNQAYNGRLYAKAQNQRRKLQAAYDEAFKNFDILVMPTTPMTAHLDKPNMTPADSLNIGWDMLGNTAPFNMTGHPSISVPCGKVNGLPVGLMLTGRHFEDSTVFRAAHAFENQEPWEKR